MDSQEERPTKRKNRRKYANEPLSPNNIPSPPNTHHPPPPNSHRPINALSFSPIEGLPAVLRVPTILLISIIISYAIGKAGFSFIFLIPLAHITYYVFSRRVTEYRRTLEALSKDKAREEVTSFETAEWINHIIKKFWDVSEQSISSIIFNEANNVLIKMSKKLPIKLKLCEITLGTRPPVIERISYLETAENRLIIECAANFIPVNASEEILAYFNDERSHWNTYIELQATLGNLVTIPILVRDFTFSGMFRIEFELSRQLPFIKKLNFCFVEMPVVDLKLIPLRSVDMLDLPYVGGLLNGIIENQIRNRMLLPKQIEVDVEEIAKRRGNLIGVVYVFVHNLETQDEKIHWLCLENGEVMGNTAKKSGRNPAFDQGFYGIINDTTESIEITQLTPEGKERTGRINLRNLDKHIYAESVNLANERNRAFVNVTTQFYPVSDSVKDSAIIYLSLISISDLQCVGDPANRLYSTYCVVSFENNTGVPNPTVLKRFETKRIFTTRDPFYNETFKFFVRDFEEYAIKIDVMNDRDNTKMGTVAIGCADIRADEVLKYRVCGMESGDMRLKFKLKYIDMSDPIEAVDEIPKEMVADAKVEEVVTRSSNTGNVVGEYMEAVDIEPTRVANNSYSVMNKPKMGIRSMRPPIQRLIHFQIALKIKVKSMNVSGMFYLIFETSRMNVKLGPFTTELEVKEEAVVPLINEKKLLVRLYRMSVNGDTLVSEEEMGIDGGIVVFGKTRVEIETENSEIGSTEGTLGDENNIKILQLHLGEVNKAGTFTVDFQHGDRVINQKLIHRVATLIVGKESVYCRLKRNNRVMSSVMIPMRDCNEDISFGDGVSAKVECLVQRCEYKTWVKQKGGILEIYLIKATAIEVEASYVKVLLNGDEIHKTNGKKGLEPTYSESVRIRVDKNADDIAFELYSINTVGIDKIVGKVQVALFNLPEDFSRHTLRLKRPDGEEAKLEVIFSYKDRSDGKLVS